MIYALRLGDIDLVMFDLDARSYTTLILRGSRGLSDETVSPELIELDRVLMTKLDAITQQVIASAIHHDTADATTERDGRLAPLERS
jgi:hypothetical protein